MMDQLYSLFMPKTLAELATRRPLHRATLLAEILADETRRCEARKAVSNHTEAPAGLGIVGLALNR